MNGKKTWLIIGIVIALILIIIVVLTFKKKTPTVSIINTPQVEQTKAPVVSEVVKATGTTMQDQFRIETPKDIKVPEVNEKLTEEQKKEIAVPVVVVPASQGITSQFRSFNIKAENNQYIPSKVIGRVGDTIHINFTAVDKDYDIIFPSYNMKQTAKKGETRVLEFQAIKEGDFTYYCELCGGVTGQTKGNIIITKP